MAISNLTDSDKKLFFENMAEIQKEYDRLYKEESFLKAEEFKKTKVKEYLIGNKKELLSLRERLFTR